MHSKHYTVTFGSNENNNYFRQGFQTLFSVTFSVTFAKLSGVRNPCLFSKNFQVSKVGQCQNTGKVERPKFSGKRMALVSSPVEQCFSTAGTRSALEDTLTGTRDLENDFNW